jgi:hypothetical protein
MKAKSDLSLSSASKNFSAAWPAQIWKAHDGIRTRDLFLTKEVLYRLSYMGIRALLNRNNRSPKKLSPKKTRRRDPSRMVFLERETGLEPATPSLEGSRSTN